MYGLRIEEDLLLSSWHIFNMCDLPQILTLFAYEMAEHPSDGLFLTRTEVTPAEIPEFDIVMLFG